MLSSRHHWTFVVLLVAGCHSVHADPLFHAPFRAFGLSREPERLATGPEESMSFRDGVVEPGLTYWYRIVLLMTRGSDLVAGKLSATIPWAISLSMPSERASGLVGVTYTIGEPSTRVSLGILDVRGRLVRIIDEGIRMAGSYERFWDRTDHGGQHSPRGVYFVRLRAGGTTLTQKLLVLHP